MTFNLSIDRIEALLADTLGPVTKTFLPNDLLYEQISTKELEEAISKIKDLINDSRLPVSGPNRISQWISGWGENLIAFAKSYNKDDLIPKYFHKYKYVRINCELVKPVYPLMELKMLRILQTHLVEKYVLTQRNQSLIEIGCGTAHNLVHLNSMFPNLILTGLDWASTSQKLILEINQHLGLSQKITAGRFDFFNPEYDLAQTWSDSTIATFAALEQTGDNFKPFIDWLLWARPSCVLHIEPEQSLLDNKNLVDKLSLEYMKSRGYLSGLLNYLLVLEKSGKIEILEKKRSYMGSYVLDGYSIIVWKPLKQ